MQVLLAVVETIHARCISPGGGCMRTHYFIAALLLLLSSILLSACEVGAAAASTSLGAITPRDTSASTLLVTIGITEDQDATDSRSTLTLQFRTAAVAEDNSVRFTHREAVTCNGVTVPLNDAPTYTLNVAQGGYTCSYTGYTPGTGRLSPVTMIDIAARSRLSPQQPTVSSKGYTISYTPDSSERACPLRADAADGAGNSSPGPTSSSDQGVYQGPAISSLTGPGTIRLQRTCSWSLHDPFDAIRVTYQSLASVVVTWSH
jgi:hypothetical protein